MIEKQLVSGEQLVRIINDRLHEYDDCRECYIKGEVASLRHPDSDGCNWSRDLELRCSSRSGGICREIAINIINEVARKYNLKEVSM